MFTRESRPARIDTLIGKAARVHGDVEFQGGLHLDGHIAGGVRSGGAPDATLSVSASGSIEGPVEVPNVRLEGTVKGDIHARGRVILGATARGEGNPKLMLRVFVQGGGCSGLQYGFEFDEQIQDGDTCVENLGVKLLVDPMSVQYLSGAEIDYREGLDGAQFVIRNPNATTTCG